VTFMELDHGAILRKETGKGSACSEELGDLGDKKSSIAVGSPPNRCCAVFAEPFGPRGRLCGNSRMSPSSKNPKAGRFGSD